MKRIVWTFGLISGAICTLMMVITIPFEDRLCASDYGEVLGYTTLVLSFLMVYFGMRSYRENVAGGQITFGRAVGVGLLITLVTCVCYVAAWEVIYHTWMPDFMDKYAAQMIHKAQVSGVTGAALQAKVDEMEKMKEMYKNPLVNVGMTFLEPLPVGIVITLISAAVLRRKAPREPEAVAEAA